MFGFLSPKTEEKTEIDFGKQVEPVRYEVPPAISEPDVMVEEQVKPVPAKKGRKPRQNAKKQTKQ